MTLQLEEPKVAAPRRTWTSAGGRSPSTGAVVRTTLLVAGAIVMIAPLVWAGLSSFKTQGELAAQPPTLFPHEPTVDNYTTGLAAFDFPRYLVNSVVVTAAATLLTLLINSMAAYALAKYNFRGRNALFLITLTGVLLFAAMVALSQLALSNWHDSETRTET